MPSASFSCWNWEQNQAQELLEVYFMSKLRTENIGAEKHYI